MLDLGVDGSSNPNGVRVGVDLGLGAVSCCVVRGADAIDLALTAGFATAKLAGGWLGDDVAQRCMQTLAL